LNLEIISLGKAFFLRRNIYVIQLGGMVLLFLSVGHKKLFGVRHLTWIQSFVIGLLKKSHIMM
jgi:hypothetical protein